MSESIRNQKSETPALHPQRGASVRNLPRPTWAEIDLAASEYNIRRIRSLLAPNVKVLAMIKAEAYGHGMAGVARAAERAGASMLGFASLSEALALNADKRPERNEVESKDAHSSTPLRSAQSATLPRLVVGWTPGWLAESAIRNDVTCMICDFETAGEFARAAQAIGKPARVHVKVDTGMHRLGFMPDEAVDAIAQIASMDGLILEGVFTHFAIADEADPAYTYGQFEKFKRILDEVEARGVHVPIKHCANSPTILRFPEMHLDMVRPGIILHGLDPSDDVVCPSDFKPVLTLKTMIASVKMLPPGSPVSYGGTYITSGYERIAVIPIGYADGFRRKPHNWGEGLVRGQRAPIVGRVCMDQCMINVTHIPEVQLGDEVVLIGAQGNDRIRAEDVAVKLGTNNYETTSLVMARVPRVYRAE
jgi:Alr-MurF fusion protein